MGFWAPIIAALVTAAGTYGTSKLNEPSEGDIAEEEKKKKAAERLQNVYSSDPFSMMRASQTKGPVIDLSRYYSR